MATRITTPEAGMRNGINGTMNGRNGKVAQIPPAMPRPPGCTCPNTGHLTASGTCLRCHADPEGPSLEPYVPTQAASTVVPAVGPAAGPTPALPAATEENVRHVKIVELERRLGKARRTITEMYTKRGFPRLHYCGPHRCWYLAEIQAWESRRPSARRA